MKYKDFTCYYLLYYEFKYRFLRNVFKYQTGSKFWRISCEQKNYHRTMRKSLVCSENFYSQPPLSSVDNAGRNAASLPTPILGVETGAQFILRATNLDYPTKIPRILLRIQDVANYLKILRQLKLKSFSNFMKGLENLFLDLLIDLKIYIQIYY